MSRTYAHKPRKCLVDDNWDFIDPSMTHHDFKRHYNYKEAGVAKYSRRKIRHALIDEDDIELANALAEYKCLSCIAANRYY